MPPKQQQLPRILLSSMISAQWTLLILSLQNKPLQTHLGQMKHSRWMKWPQSQKQCQRKNSKRLYALYRKDAETDVHLSLHIKNKLRRRRKNQSQQPSDLSHRSQTQKLPKIKPDLETYVPKTNLKSVNL